MKRLVKFFMCLVLALSLLASQGVAEKVSAASSSGFYVNGTKLYDANGKEFIMRGINYPHAWFAGNYSSSLKAIANTGANCVRIVLSDGEKYSKTSQSEINNLIKECKANKLVAILEVHDATGSDSASSLNNAVNFWINNKNSLIGNEAYVIVNIANEWYGTWNSAGWKNGYVSAIPKLRNAGIKNTLMVDCAGWGQYPQSVVDYGTTVFAADPLKNTMFSVHMYEYAGGNATMVKNNINNILNKNLCLTVGEFGGYHTDGDVDEDTIMSHTKSKNVGWLAWSWCGNGSEFSFLDLSNNFSGSSLTTWGKRVISGTDGIKATSSLCTVFTNGTSGSSSKSPSTSKYYKIVNKKSGKCLTPKGFGASNGTVLVQATYEANTSQQWKLVDCGSGYYKIKNRYSGLVLDISGKSTANGASAIVYDDKNGTNQMFKLSNFEGYGTITNRNSGLALDIKSASTSENAECIQYTNKGSDNQLFEFVEVK